MLLLDVKKSFDTLNYGIIFDKLHHLGIDPTWFKSYLTNRKQSVSINGELLESLDKSCGVTQDSLLSPLLYVCYSNDIELAV